MSTVSEVSSMMGQVCDELERQRWSAMAKVGANAGFTGGLWGPGGVSSSGDLDNLKSYGDWIARMRPEGSEGARVLAGDTVYTLDAWRENAKEIRNGIAFTVGDLSTWGIEGFMDSVVWKTGSDVGDLVGNAKDQIAAHGEDVLTLVVVGLVAFAVIYVAGTVRAFKVA